MGIKDKPAALTALQNHVGVSVEQTAFVGDDLNDLAVRPVVGLLFAPADACQPVRRGADAVLRRRGGHGAVRELAEKILQARGRWGRLSRDGWKTATTEIRPWPGPVPTAQQCPPTARCPAPGRWQW